MIEFVPFPKRARLSREILITEKLDGTNAQVIIKQLERTGLHTTTFPGALAIIDNFVIAAGSRTRLIKPGKDTDNFGFAAWVLRNAGELVKLGPGRHFGEWYGKGIQRGYDLDDRRFALFNASKWHVAGPGPRWSKVSEDAPSCCEVVPVLARGQFDTAFINDALSALQVRGSRAVWGFMKPEGIVVYHTASNTYFKKTFEQDETGKEVRQAWL